MLINNEIEEVLRVYPSLTVDTDNQTLYGELFVSADDFYNVSIDIKSYPELFPVVHELDERIPRKEDRHIYSDTGSCCFSTAAKGQVLLKTKVTSLRHFVREIVIPYFQNNSYFELNGHYNTDHYSHGREGILEGYKDLLEIKDFVQVAQVMYNRVVGVKLKTYHECYCGSGVKMKKCTGGTHDRAFRLFKLIDKSIVAHDLEKSVMPQVEALLEANNS